MAISETRKVTAGYRKRMPANVLNMGYNLTHNWRPPKRTWAPAGMSQRCMHSDAHWGALDRAGQPGSAGVSARDLTTTTLSMPSFSSLTVKHRYMNYAISTADSNIVCRVARLRTTSNVDSNHSSLVLFSLILHSHFRHSPSVSLNDWSHT